MPNPKEAPCTGKECWGLRKYTLHTQHGRSFRQKEYSLPSPAVQVLCPRCALFIPKRSQHGKNVCRWTGEVLTAATMPLFCCGYTVEVVHG
ncbi:MAG: hypothetical protein PHN64_08760 [Desulfovibrionaceae bacterium]|nr:hypothetical protein [Desulfovibrionaceae bacterium]